MNERIQRLRQQSLEAVPTVSSERAALLTDFYRSGKADRVSVPVARALALCHLAGRPGGDPGRALAALETPGREPGHAEAMEARFLLWRATGDAVHLREARRLLTRLEERAPESLRRTLLERVPLHRAIAEAAADNP